WLPCLGSKGHPLPCPLPSAAARLLPSWAAWACWISSPFPLTVRALEIAFFIANGGLGSSHLHCACAPLAFHTSSRVQLMWQVISSDSVLRACSSATVSA